MINVKSYYFGLTNRELEILDCVVKGFPNNKIGKILYISEKTVKNHLTNIFYKLGVENRTMASIKAIKNNLIDLNSLNI